MKNFVNFSLFFLDNFVMICYHLYRHSEINGKQRRTMLQVGGFLMFKIQKVGDMPRKRIKMLLHGMSDTGKTYLTSRLHLEGIRTLILDAEGGMRSATAETEVAEINALSDLVEAYRFLRDSEHDYQCVVIDSITEVQLQIVNWLVRDYQSTGKGISNNELGTLEIGGWNALSEKFRHALRSIRDLPMDVVFTSLTRLTTKSDDGESMYLPMLYGSKTPFEVVGWMDFVGYTERKEVRKKDSEGKVFIEPSFAIRFRRGNQIFAKCRGGILDTYEKANLGQIFSKIRNADKEMLSLGASEEEVPDELVEELLVGSSEE